MIEVPSVLADAAADRLDERGWCQRTYGIMVPDPNGGKPVFGPCCMYGALLEEGSATAATRVLDMVRAVVGCRSPVKWQDEQDRKKCEVTTALRRAAASLRRRGQ